MARGALVRLQARDGSRTSDKLPSLACRASASITGCVRKSLLRLRPYAYLTRDHRLVAATAFRLKTKRMPPKRPLRVRAITLSDATLTLPDSNQMVGDRPRGTVVKGLFAYCWGLVWLISARLLRYNIPQI